MKIDRVVLLLLAAAVAPAFAAAPAWDASGNSQLSGTYYFRQVLYVGASGGGISQAVTFYGNITFSGSGSGTYTSSGTLTVSGSGVQAYAPSGAYSVSASGYGFMSSPLAALFPTGINGTAYFMVSNHILIGSETESGYDDMIVAAPYSSSLSAASFNGAYTISAFFPSGSPATSLDATYQLNSTGSGTLGNVSMVGYSGAGAAVSQSSSGVKYAFSNGAYSITFPTSNSAVFYQGGTSTNTSGDNGPVFLYMSPDSNFVFGGTQLGFDMFVGVKNAASGASTPLSGLYYEAGFDDNENTGLDAYYGSFNTFSGNIIGHERILYSGFATEGYTYYDSYPASISGTYTDSSNTVNYTVGQDGIRIGFGTNGYLGIEVGLPFTPPATSGSVYIDPTGIVNTASSAPYTAGISPGDFVTLYNGVNLASQTVFAPPGAFPTTGLGGVTVLIDSFISAPLYYVSATQISFIVPYEVSTYPIASIQVNNNGKLSNIATTYVNLTTPGVFTSAPVGGIGVAAMIDYPASGGTPFIVSESKPVEPNDTIALYLTGLGAPFPSNGDGALGPHTGDGLMQSISVDVSGADVGTPPYEGLAPDLAGLYQVNFTVPASCTATGQTGCVYAGDNLLGISGPDSYNDESVIPVGSGAIAASSEAPAAAAARPLRKALPVPRKLATRVPAKLGF